MVDNFLDRLPSIPWIILFSPLVATALITFFFQKSPKISAGVALAGIFTSLVGSVSLFWFHSHNHFLPAESSWSWIRIAGLSVDFGFLLDPLSILMLLVVTGVGSCVFLYSTAYMKDDSSYARYFASLSLFAFSMLGIVLANNFLMLFVFWELVAVSSYLLIGFWFEKPSAADAGNKAFIVNRVADFGFILGIFLVWMLSGAGGGEKTFQFSTLAYSFPGLLQSGLISQALLMTAILLIFCGVAGKSAQFPLYIWLPDAMEGPTPVSALIHAATMVAAGVYLLSRSFFLVSTSVEALHIIAWFGGITALLAALLALVQNDIKKILAYSTVSQLGYMVMAVGLGSANVAMYHLTTHAFFKALLFLGAGAMIHALHTQDIWEMGGLLKKMPVTAITFLIGTLALCGIFPFSGFFSKDEILTLALEHNKPLFVIGLFTAGLTAFYMTRAVWVAILGHARTKKKHHDNHSHNHAPSHGHDAPWPMKLPLVALAFLSIIAGFIGIPAFIAGEHGEHMPMNYWVAGISTVVALTGIGLGTLTYRKLMSNEDPLKKMFGQVYSFVVHKYYLDEFFVALANVFSAEGRSASGGQKSLAGLLLWFDLNIVIEKGANGTAALTRGVGSLVRRAQTGRLQTYAMAFGFGIVLLLYWTLLR